MLHGHTGVSVFLIPFLPDFLQANDEPMNPPILPGLFVQVPGEIRVDQLPIVSL